MQKEPPTPTETATYSTSTEEKTGYSQHNDEFSYDKLAKKKEAVLNHKTQTWPPTPRPNIKRVFPTVTKGFPHNIRVFIPRWVFPEQATE